MRTHIITQTGYIDFFNSLTWKSAAMFERANKDDLFIVVGFVPQMKDVADGLIASGHHVKYVDVSDFAQCRIADIMKRLDMSMTSCNMSYIATFNIFNGACNSFQQAELDTFSAYCKTFGTASVKRDLPLIDAAGTVYKALMYVVYEMLSVIMQYNIALNARKTNGKQQGTVINNFVEDPLQHKLNYIDYRYSGPYESAFSASKIFKVQHWYFHDCNNVKKLGLEYNSAYVYDVTAEQDAVAYYGWCPSQQYWYLHGKTWNDIEATFDDKRLNFAFALTNTWRDKTERTELINKLMHLHNQDAIDKGIVFRFFSRDKQQQPMSDKLLPYDTYLELIKHSRFTLIVPSYDANCFSLRRFCESIVLGCVPLVHNSCKLYMFDRWPKFKKFVIEKLMVSDDDLQHLEDVVQPYRHAQLLKELWHTDFIQQYTGDFVYDIALHLAYINKTVPIKKSCANCDNTLSHERCVICEANNFMSHAWSCSYCKFCKSDMSCALDADDGSAACCNGDSFVLKEPFVEVQ